VQWYTAAAQRFRRAQWRTKAEEALTRLGAPIPEAIQTPAPQRTADAAESAAAGAADLSPAPMGIPYDPTIEAGVDRERSHGPDELELPAAGVAESVEEGATTSAVGSAAGGTGTVKRRRRGRRGGRKRRGRSAAGQPAGPAASRAEGAPAETARSSRLPYAAAERGYSPTPLSGSSGAGVAEVSSERAVAPEVEAPFESHGKQERPAASAWQGGSPGLVSSRSRAGDPGLSSRISHLESQLRRLLACPLALLDDADQAPAGPGVLLLSDSDQVTHYYVEACQTLRIGIGNLLRGGRGSKGAAQLKPSLAEHLGISDSKVLKYMKDHCAVRWIQLDEGAPDLAHFAMAVLRPVVTE
jgi:hypothetical protein